MLASCLRTPPFYQKLRGMQQQLEVCFEDPLKLKSQHNRQQVELQSVIHEK